MKALPIVCVALLLFLVLARTSFSSANSTAGACKQNVRSTCSSSSESCGRYGRSRAYICQLFKNDCQRKLTNCEGENKYHRVSRHVCAGMTVGKQSSCGGSRHSSSSNSSNTRIIYD